MSNTRMKVEEFLQNMGFRMTTGTLAKKRVFKKENEEFEVHIVSNHVIRLHPLLFHCKYCGKNLLVTKYMHGTQRCPNPKCQRVMSQKYLNAQEINDLIDEQGAEMV